MKGKVKFIIFILSYFHFFILLITCWSAVDEYKSVDEFLKATDKAKRGYATFVEIDPHGKTTDYVYNIYDSNDLLINTTRGGGNISRFSPENYLGLKYVCYYDSVNPCKYYICYDSIIFEMPPVYKTIGYIKHISIVDDIAILTFRWKSSSGNWHWIEQAVSLVNVDKYKYYKRNRQPIDVFVYKMEKGYLAHIL